ncbi:MAG TPA: pectin acetylesterase-family hydrolase [Polyangiaceae bacterium]|nr:pectin acetylesterase-family hydrolase [Polyangiaceae bacterium]
MNVIFVRASCLVALSLASCQPADADAPDVVDDVEALDAEGGNAAAPERELARARPVPRATTDASGAIAAAAEEWSWLDLPESRCTNNAPTGVGINIKPDAEDLMIYLVGGGACWNFATCAIGTASNVRFGYDQKDFEKDKIRDWSLFNRGEAKNPFREATQVIVPYCTADVHAGARVATYTGAGIPLSMVHFGAKNIAALVPRLQATFPQIKRVQLVGTSAGGFGAQLNYPSFAAAFPNATVSVLADSAQMIAPNGSLTEEWVRQWGIPLPPDCAGCASNFPAYVDYLNRTYPQGRFGLLASTRDLTLRTFFGYPLDANGFEGRTNDLLDDQYEPYANASFRARRATRHGYLNGFTNVNNQVNADTFAWVEAFLKGDAPNQSPN